MEKIDLVKDSIDMFSKIDNLHKKLIEKNNIIGIVSVKIIITSLEKLLTKLKTTEEELENKLDIIEELSSYRKNLVKLFDKFKNK
jgi:excinuclease UvrABC helicase subunit UvrB